MKNASDLVLRIGDLHLGNINTDLIAFIRLLRSVVECCADYVREIVLLGDVVDGMDKYATQSYKQSPEPLTTQREMLKWLIEGLGELFPKADVILVVGNHEYDARGSFIDFELIEEVYRYVRFKDRHLDADEILNIHSPPGRSYGSKIVGFTPQILNLLKDLVIEELKKGRPCRGVAIAHLHKVAAILATGTSWFMLLPSLMMEKNDKVIAKPFIIASNLYRGIMYVFETEWSNENNKKLMNEAIASCVLKNRNSCKLKELVLNKQVGKNSEIKILPDGGGINNLCFVIHYAGRRHTIRINIYNELRSCIESKSINECAKQLGVSEERARAVILGRVVFLTRC